MCVSFGSASLRQNIRGQELSYRGAWHCASGPCEESAMVRSTTGSREGTMNINEVQLAPKAGLAFTAASPFDSLGAALIDCEGERSELPASSVVAAGKHGLGDEAARESWIVWLDPSLEPKLDAGPGACGVWKVEASASWSDGASYTLRAGAKVGG